jgi:hypothetical protein
LARLPWAVVHQDGSITAEVKTELGVSQGLLYSADFEIPGTVWRTCSSGAYAVVRAAPAAHRPGDVNAALAEAERIERELLGALAAKRTRVFEEVRAWAATPVEERSAPLHKDLAMRVVPEAVREYEEYRERWLEESKAQAEARRQQLEQEKARREDEAIREIGMTRPDVAQHIKDLLSEGYEEQAWRMAQDALQELRTPVGFQEVLSLMPGAESWSEEKLLRVTPRQLRALRDAKEATANVPGLKNLRLVWLVGWSGRSSTSGSDVVHKGPALLADLTVEALGSLSHREVTVGSLCLSEDE